MARFRTAAERREPIIGGGAGTGLSARSEAAGGIDLLVTCNSGRYRTEGRGSLAHGSVNEIVQEMAREVRTLPITGLIDAVFRQDLEQTGIGFGSEVDMIRLGHAEDMLTTGCLLSAARRRR